MSDIYSYTVSDYSFKMGGVLLVLIHDKLGRSSEIIYSPGRLQEQNTPVRECRFEMRYVPLTNPHSLLTYPMSFSQVIQFADVLYKIDGAVSGKTPQYKDLQAMHESYGDKGLVMIGFPCNQVSSVYSDLTLLIRSTSILHTFPGIFPARSCSNPTGVENGQFNGQEPGTDDEVLQFCQLNYGVTFPIAKKVCTPLIDDRRSMLSGLGAMVDACISMQGNVNGPETQPIWKYLKAQATPPVEEIDWVYHKGFYGRPEQN